MRTMSSRVIHSFWIAGLVCLISIFGHPSFASEKMKVKVLTSIAAGEQMGRFKRPYGLFYDELKQRLYIADSVNNRLVSLDSEFRYLAELTRKEILLPVGLVRDSKGIFYVVDAGRAEILVVDIKKEKALPLSLKGLPRGTDLLMPGKIAIDREDNLYIVDKLNKRIVIADTNGTFIRSVTAKGDDFSGFTDVRVDEKGYLYALDTISRKVHVFNSKGKTVSTFGSRDEGSLLFPVSLAVGKNGFVYILDRHAGRIMVFNRKGNFQYAIAKRGAASGELSTPSYILIDESNRIFIIDGNRIQVFKEVVE